METFVHHPRGEKGGGETVVSKCVSCNGVGQQLCSRCNGVGKMLCGACKGAGMIETQTGTKEIEVKDEKNQPMMKTIPTFFRGGCEDCSGGGVVTCTACRGSRRMVCTGCNGSGQA